MSHSAAFHELAKRETACDLSFSEKRADATFQALFESRRENPGQSTTFFTLSCRLQYSLHSRKVRPCLTQDIVTLSLKKTCQIKMDDSVMHFASPHSGI